MKSLMTAIILTLSISNVFASGLYIVDPMICNGTLLPNTRVHESYSVLLQKFESFRSRRRNGTLAPSLEVSNTYGDPGEVINPRTAVGQEVWQMAPLRLKGKQVTHPDFVGSLNLKITSSKTVNGKRTDTLTGVWIQSDSVVGGHGYKLKCKANVVSVPSRLDDLICRHGNNCQ